MQMREKVGKSRNPVFFQWFVAPEGRKVGSLKRRVRSQLARWEMKIARRCGAKHIPKSKCTKHTILGPLLEVEMSKKCTLLWREAHFEVKMLKTPRVRTTFGDSDVGKVHAVVARSTFRGQNVQNTLAPDHFWQLRYRKSARRCGAKHISKSKCTKHTTFGPLLEVEMSKKCTLLWREAHFEVKMLKTPGVRTVLEVQMSKKCMPLWREAHFEVNMYKTLGVRTTFGGSDVASLHYTTLHYTTLHYTTLDDITLHYAPLHYTTLHHITLHYTTLHYTTLHYTTLSSTTLHYLTLHYTPLHYNYNYNYTTTQLHSTTLHYTKLHYTTLHYTALHYTTFRHTPLHHTTLHYTTLHWMILHHR